MRDNADPLHGWSAEDVEGSSSGAATADIYGKLFYYLRKLLRAFVHRLSDLHVSFRLLQTDVSDLPAHLEKDCFDRIEVRRRGLPRVPRYPSSQRIIIAQKGLQYLG